MCGVAFVRVVIATLLCVFISPPAHAAQDDIVGVASVIDGDTIDIHGQRIRFFGIDAPESGQSCEDARGEAYRCGQKAALALDELLSGRTVRCERRDVDRFGRVVAICRVGSADANAFMVERGLAVAYRHYSMDYVANEERAHAAKRGLWAGDFEMPWDYRAHEHFAAPAPGLCCKVCHTGKACGNSCIARTKICRRPTGCACN